MGAGAGSYGTSKAALWSITNSLRVELADQQTHVVGVHLGSAHTEMISSVTAVEPTPGYVAAVVLGGLENGGTEVLADDISRSVTAALPGPVENLTLTIPQ